MKVAENLSRVGVKQDNQLLPQFLRPFFWSYDLDRMDKENDKQIIIKNILDFGTVETTDWLKQNYTKQEIKLAIKKSIQADWSKKSINYWSLIYGVEPRQSRF